MANEAGGRFSLRKMAWLGLILAWFGVAGLALLWLSPSSPPEVLHNQPPEATQVIVALQPITRAAEFVAGSIGRRDRPPEMVPPDTIRDEAETIGRIASKNIAPGQTIVRSMLMPLSDWLLSTRPVLSSGVIYLGRENGRFYAIDIETGKDRWSAETGRVLAPPILAGGEIYLLSEADNQGHVLALDPRTGRELWRHGPIPLLYTPNTTAPVVIDNRIYVAGAADVYALSTEIGWEIWRFTPDSPMASPLIVAGGQVYFTTRSGLVYALDAQTGREQWQTKPSSPD